MLFGAFPPMSPEVLTPSSFAGARKKGETLLDPDGALGMA